MEGDLSEMLSVIYEDMDVIVVRKPAGVEAQAARGFERDMVSEIRRYLSSPQDIHKLATGKSTRGTGGQPPYVGVIHRLDKPVSGVMVYGKNQRASGALSAGLQAGKMEKWYRAVVCGKPVDNQGEYVDYLRQDRKNNRSEIVDKSVGESKKAVLRYRVLEVIHREVMGVDRECSLVEIQLLTGRHHQIRVQFAGHGTPLLGDERYGRGWAQGRKQESEMSEQDVRSAAGEEWFGMREEIGDYAKKQAPRREARLPLALCACRLAFLHPVSGKRMEFEIKPEGGAFEWFTV